MSNLTTKQTKSLVDEFIKFVMDDWTPEQMRSYVYDSLKQEIVCTRNHLPLQESLKLQIDEYDENLYEVLEDYVTDTVGSYTALQEFSDGSNPILIEEAWNEAEELNTSLRELSDADLVDCRAALIDRTKRIMDTLNEIGTDE